MTQHPCVPTQPVAPAQPDWDHQSLLASSVPGPSAHTYVELLQPLSGTSNSDSSPSLCLFSSEIYLVTLVSAVIPRLPFQTLLDPFPRAPFKPMGPLSCCPHLPKAKQPPHLHIPGADLFPRSPQLHPAPTPTFYLPSRSGLPSFSPSWSPPPHLCFY